MLRRAAPSTGAGKVPCSSTICLAMDSPRPLPPPFWLRPAPICSNTCSAQCFASALGSVDGACACVFVSDAACLEEPQLVSLGDAHAVVPARSRRARARQNPRTRVLHRATHLTEMDSRRHVGSSMPWCSSSWWSCSRVLSGTSPHGSASTSSATALTEAALPPNTLSSCEPSHGPMVVWHVTTPVFSATNLRALLRVQRDGGDRRRRRRRERGAPRSVPDEVCEHLPQPMRIAEENDVAVRRRVVL
jgi:hypothetical protein